MSFKIFELTAGVYFNFNNIRGSLSCMASGVVGFSRRELGGVCTGMDLAHRRLTPDSLLNISDGGMDCVSCDICVYHLGLFVFFPGVFLSSRVTGACPVTTDLIMRVNLRTTVSADVLVIIYSVAHTGTVGSPPWYAHGMYIANMLVDGLVLSRQDLV